MAARPLALAALLAAATLAPAGPARAERLIATLSGEVVSIASNFTGSQIAFFGAIERDAQSVPRPSTYEIVVVAEGPPVSAVTRQKRRTLGLWINRDSESYRLVPAFHAVLASSPFTEVADEATRARLGLGLDMLPLRREAGPTPPFRSAFEKAFLRLMQAEGRYFEAVDGVDFLTPTLFQGKLAFPANVPIGTYDIRFMLFQDGVKLAEESRRIEVAKVGFEQMMTRFSREHGYLYGLATVVMASLTGWLAGVIFRRD